MQYAGEGAAQQSQNTGLHLGSGGFLRSGGTVATQDLPHHLQARAGKGRSFVQYRYADAHGVGGDHLHLVEDYVQGRGPEKAWRGTCNTAITLSKPLAARMSLDRAFEQEVLAFCNARRHELEKTTVVFDPSVDHKIERLFPKWLYTKRNGGAVREGLACVALPVEMLELMRSAPANFASTPEWRAWVANMPPSAAAISTEMVPGRITALVLANPQYFTVPEYRSWIGRAKQRKREEIIAREVEALYGERTTS